MAWYNILNIGLLIVIGIIVTSRFNRIFTERKFWLLFFGTYILTELIATWISVQHKSNLWLYNISRPIQFFFLLLYFSSILNLSGLRRVYLLGAGTLAIILLIVSSGNDSFNSLGEVVFGAGIAVLSVIYFDRMIRSNMPVYFSASEFWYCSALFIFYGSSLCVNGAMDFLIKNNLPVAQKLFYVLVGNSYVFYALTIFALLSNYRPNTLN